MPRRRVSQSSAVLSLPFVMSCTYFLNFREGFARAISPQEPRGRTTTLLSPSLPALEDEPDERQQIRQLHDGDFQKQVGAEKEQAEIHVRLHAHDCRHGD